MRIIQLVTSSLALDKMKAEEKLQSVINSNDDIDKKLNKIKKILSEVVNIDNMIRKWMEYLPPEESNNNN
jgi:hypothetical protein